MPSSGGPAAAPDPDTVAAELYRVPPEEFVAERDARVAEARAAGDKSVAKRIGAFKRPTRAAWLTNLLVADAPDDVEGLLALADTLADAQRSLDGPALRKVSAQRTKLVNALARRAAGLGRSAGHRVDHGLEREVGVVLESALADPELAEQVRSGRLVRFERHSGFGPVTPGAGTGGDDDGSRSTGGRGGGSGRARGHGPAGSGKSSSTASTDGAGGTDETGRREREQQERDRRRRERLVAEAQERLDRARTDADDAAADRDSARERAESAAADRDEARRRVDELAEELERARDTAGDADRAARSAERSASTAARRAREADAAVTRAEEKLRAARED